MIDFCYFYNPLYVVDNHKNMAYLSRWLFIIMKNDNL